MALLDFLKRKKEVEKAREKKTDKKTDEVSVAKETISKKQAIRIKNDVKGFSYEVVREPHISEKSTNLGTDDKYVFKVYSHANKPQIKKSVEGIYGVDVLSVNTIKIPKKKRRIGRTEGFKKGYIKAVVTIKEGQKIDLF